MRRIAADPENFHVGGILNAQGGVGMIFAVI